jgi:hypothetical protein
MTLTRFSVNRKVLDPVTKFEKELKAGTKIVMESFPIHGWKPIKESVTNRRRFYFYTMPPEKTEG